MRPGDCGQLTLVTFGACQVPLRASPSPVSPMEANRARTCFSESLVGAYLNWKSSRSKNFSEVFCLSAVSGTGQSTAGAAAGAGSLGAGTVVKSDDPVVLEVVKVR